VCEKVGYASPGEAYWALRDVRKRRKKHKRKGRKTEKGYYQCPRPGCGKWHLTSQKQG